MPKLRNAGAARVAARAAQAATRPRSEVAVTPKRRLNDRENAQRFSKPLARAISVIAIEPSSTSRRARVRRCSTSTACGVSPNTVLNEVALDALERRGGLEGVTVGQWLRVAEGARAELVDRICAVVARAVNPEHVALADVLHELHLEAVVGEAVQFGLAEGHVERGAHRFRELLATGASEDADRLHGVNPNGVRNAASGARVLT